MLGLIVRIGILLAVVFGVVYAVVRARRRHAHSVAAERIREDIRLLKAGLEEGLYDDEEYRRIRDSIQQACEREGIHAPDLPPHIRPREGQN